VSRASGTRAEQLALSYLEARGLTPVATNYRSRFGEIDLIVRDGKTLVFVEVRMRRSTQFASAAESITAGKRRKLIATAQHYLSGLHELPPCRFDAVLLGSGAQPTIEWLRNAFSAD
jgi:putative endonuclease